MENEVRPLNAGELSALVLLSKRLSHGEQERFLRDLHNCTVWSATNDGSRLVFGLASYTRPTYDGQHAYPVEGLVTDADGADLVVCVYADHQDRLLELELIKWGNRPVIAPDWATFRVRY